MTTTLSKKTVYKRERAPRVEDNLGPTPVHATPGKYQLCDPRYLLGAENWGRWNREAKEYRSLDFQVMEIEEGTMIQCSPLTGPGTYEMPGSQFTTKSTIMLAPEAFVQRMMEEDVHYDLEGEPLEPRVFPMVFDIGDKPVLVEPEEKMWINDQWWITLFSPQSWYTRPAI